MPESAPHRRAANRETIRGIGGEHDGAGVRPVCAFVYSWAAILLRGFWQLSPGGQIAKGAAPAPRGTCPESILGSGYSAVREPPGDTSGVLLIFE